MYAENYPDYEPERSDKRKKLVCFIIHNPNRTSPSQPIFLVNFRIPYKLAIFATLPDTVDFGQISGLLHTNLL